MVDVQASSVLVRLLAYSLVPGIIINSSFFKGVTIVSKQVTVGLPPISAPTGKDLTGSIVSSSKGKKKGTALVHF